MRLFLVRHAIAIERDHAILSDGERFLTTDGRRRFRKVARRFAKEAGDEVERIITSPLVRAVQTAELLAVHVGFRGAVEVWPSLADPGAAAGVLHRVDELGARERVALVGHEPQMSALASLLIGREFPLPFPKGGIACFDRRGRRASRASTLRWLLVPKGRRFVGLDGEPLKAPR